MAKVQTQTKTAIDLSEIESMPVLHSLDEAMDWLEGVAKAWIEGVQKIAEVYGAKRTLKAVRDRFAQHEWRALAAAALATGKQGRKPEIRHGGAAFPPTQAEAAEAVGVSERSVRSAKKHINEGTADDVIAGKIALNESCADKTLTQEHMKVLILRQVLRNYVAKLTTQEFEKLCRSLAGDRIVNEALKGETDDA